MKSKKRSGYTYSELNFISSIDLEYAENRLLFRERNRILDQIIVAFKEVGEVAPA